MFRDMASAGYMTPQEETEQLMSFNYQVQLLNTAVSTDLHFFKVAATHFNVEFLSQRGRIFREFSLQEKSMILLNTCSPKSFRRFGSNIVPFLDDEFTTTLDYPAFIPTCIERCRHTVKWLLCNGADPNFRYTVHSNDTNIHMLDTIVSTGTMVCGHRTQKRKKRNASSKLLLR